MGNIVNQLRRNGVIGMNRRNAEFLLPYNARRLYPLVDDKLQTKQLALAAGIDVPPLYGVVEIERQVRELPGMLAEHRDFVIKPAHGSGGQGILVIDDQRKGRYRKPGGNWIDGSSLRHHVSNILGGVYSLGGQQDKALIEYRVRFDPVFERISYLGVPDIRIVVFLGVPVMAMVRLPTRLSGGRANLHQGAIGAGIDIKTGETLSAVWFNDIIDEHPDTGNTVSGVTIPHWHKLLELASRCHDLTGLGYIGVDFVLDASKGPLMLEMNARPGLNIQVANHSGLYARLKRVEQEKAAGQLVTTESRIGFAKDHFST